MLWLMEKMGVVEDSFKLPTKSITDHWNSLHHTSALSFHRYYVNLWKHSGRFSLFPYRSNPIYEFPDLLWTGPGARLCWDSRTIRPPIQLLNQKSVHISGLSMLCYGSDVKLPPHSTPPAENQNSVELLQCFGAGALNCLIGQITLFLVVKRHFGVGETRKIERNSKRKSVLLGWFTADLTFLELPAGLLPTPIREIPGCSARFALSSIFQRKRGWDISI